MAEVKPQRIQRKRSKGWKMSEQSERQVVYVGRPGKWGNPYQVSVFGRKWALELYEDWIANEIEIAPGNLEEIKEALGGKDLACWCPLDQPCHADILLELANKDHNTEIDGVGWSGRVRLTCYDCNETLVYQPYMNLQDWLEKVRLFSAAHPSQVITDYCERILI